MASSITNLEASSHGGRDVAEDGMFVQKWPSVCTSLWAGRTGFALRFAPAADAAREEAGVMKRHVPLRGGPIAIVRKWGMLWTTYTHGAIVRLTGGIWRKRKVTRHNAQAGPTGCAGDPTSCMSPSFHINSLKRVFVFRPRSRLSPASRPELQRNAVG